MSQGLPWLRDGAVLEPRKGNVRRRKPVPEDWWKDSRPCLYSEMSTVRIGDSATVSCN
jgi:hypothetical protein